MKSIVCLAFVIIGASALPYAHEEKCSLPNEVYRDCGTACPVSCFSPEVRACANICAAGCFCEPGYFREKKSGRCVTEAQCEYVRLNGYLPHEDTVEIEVN